LSIGAKAGKGIRCHNEALLRLLGKIAHQCGTRAFLVGGPVRDMLLDRFGPDIDIAVESKAQTVGKEIGRRVHGRFVFHSRFLTATVTLPDSSHIDITQTRTETYSRPAVLPRVKPAPIEQDLFRRDFTINAMALEITPFRFGYLLDPCSGQQDLKYKLVRILHPKSFIDDPTRIFRAIRFAIRLGFGIEPQTLKLMRQSIKSSYPSLLTAERILYELRLISSETRRLQMIEAIKREKLTRTCLDWSPPSHFLSKLKLLSSRTRNPELFFILILSNLPDTGNFPITKQERESARAINRFHLIHSRLMRAKRLSTIYRLLHPIPEPALQILSRIEPRAVARAINLYLNRLSSIRPTVTGRELRKLGLMPGPKYQRILDRLLYARLDGLISKEKEYNMARRLIRQKKV